MAQAQYEILIPQHPLNLAPHALSYLTTQVEAVSAHVETPRQVAMAGETGWYDPLVFIAEENPQTDSHAKQVAAYVGEAANVPSVLVTRHGKQGIQVWPIRNPQYQPSNLNAAPM